MWQSENLQFDDIQPTLTTITNTLKRYLLDLEGGPMVKQMEGALYETGTHAGMPVTFGFNLDFVADLSESEKLQMSRVQQTTEFDILKALANKHTQDVLNALANRFPDTGLVAAFSIFAPNKYIGVLELQESSKLSVYGLESLNTLLEHYGNPKQKADGTMVPRMIVPHTIPTGLF